MSSGKGDKPTLKPIIHSVIRSRMIGADTEDADLTWELGFHIEGAVFDAIWDNLPRGYSRDLVEEVLGLVDWERVAEKATWDMADDEEVAV